MTSSHRPSTRIFGKALASRHGASSTRSKSSTHQVASRSRLRARTGRRRRRTRYGPNGPRRSKAPRMGARDPTGRKTAKLGMSTNHPGGAKAVVSCAPVDERPVRRRFLALPRHPRRRSSHAVEFGLRTSRALVPLDQARAQIAAPAHQRGELGCAAIQRLWPRFGCRSRSGVSAFAACAMRWPQRANVADSVGTVRLVPARDPASDSRPGAAATRGFLDDFSLPIRNVARTPSTRRRSAPGRNRWESFPRPAHNVVDHWLNAGDGQRLSAYIPIRPRSSRHIGWTLTSGLRAVFFTTIPALSTETRVAVDTRVPQLLRLTKLRRSNRYLRACDPFDNRRKPCRGALDMDKRRALLAAPDTGGVKCLGSAAI